MHESLTNIDRKQRLSVGVCLYVRCVPTHVALGEVCIYDDSYPPTSPSTYEKQCLKKLSQVTFPRQIVETAILIPDQRSSSFALMHNAF